MCCYCPAHTHAGVSIEFWYDEGWRTVSRIMPAYGLADGQEIILFYHESFAADAYQSQAIAAA